MSRFRQALRTNGPQSETVAMLFVIQSAACIGSGCPVLYSLISSLIWPLLAYLGNLIDPIP